MQYAPDCLPTPPSKDYGVSGTSTEDGGGCNFLGEVLNFGSMEMPGFSGDIAEG